MVTDGSAVLGLGNIGPMAALPVMEGKAALFKRFAGIDAWPICLDTQDADEIVAIGQGDRARLRRHQPGGHLRAALLRDRARGCARTLDIPVFHDDQHGTAIVVLAALTNALRVVGKQIGDVRIVMSGAGAAGTAILKLLIDAGAKRHHRRRPPRRRARRPGRTSADADPRELRWVAEHTNPASVTGTLKEARASARTSSSASPRPNILTGADIATMADGAIVFALANPDPEVDPARPASTPRWSPPAAATSRTRSTTCWPSPASSAACSTRSPAPSTPR